MGDAFDLIRPAALTNNLTNSKNSIARCIIIALLMLMEQSLVVWYD